MEVKHRELQNTHHHHRHLSLSLPNLSSSSSSIHCYRFKPWIHSKISINKNFQLWRFHILKILKPEIQTPCKQQSAHLIKGAQNLNSNLRQYGVSVDLIGAGAAKNTMDFDHLLLKYQLLDTLAFAREHSRLIKKNASSSLHREGLVFHGNSEQKPLKMLTAHGLPHAKSSGYVLVLVPFIAFCITCIISAFSTRVPKDNGNDALDGSTRHKHQPKSMRWKHVLSDNSETDEVVSVLQSAPEYEDENLFEEDTYSKVENDYQKFLSECGISECGYQHRRGGIHQ